MMVIDRDLFMRASQAISSFSKNYQGRTDIPEGEVNQLLKILKDCNAQFRSNETVDAQVVTDISSALKNFPGNLKSNQEKVAALLASLVQEKTKLENNIKDKDKFRRVERSNKSQQY